jgi:hypothetical protein
MPENWGVRSLYPAKFPKGAEVATGMADTSGYGKSLTDWISKAYLD